MYLYVGRFCASADQTVKNCVEYRWAENGGRATRCGLASVVNRSQWNISWWQRAGSAPHTTTDTHTDTHTHTDTETDTCTHGHTRTHRQGRQDRHDWHLNLTFQDTCVEQLLQCFWCLIMTQATAVVWKEYSACPACCEGSHFGEKKWPVSAIVRSQCSVARLPLKRLYQVGSPDWTIKAQSVSFSQVLTSNPTSPGHLHTSLN